MPVLAASHEPPAPPGKCRKSFRGHTRLEKSVHMERFLENSASLVSAVPYLTPEDLSYLKAQLQAKLNQLHWTLETFANNLGR